MCLMKVIFKNHGYYVGTDLGCIISEKYKTLSLENMALETLRGKKNIILFNLKESDIVKLNEEEVGVALKKLNPLYTKLAVKFIDARVISVSDLLFEECVMH